MTWATEQSSRSNERLPNGWNVRTFEELLAEPVRNGIYKKKEFHGRGQKIINMGELFAHNFISDQEMKRVELNTKEMSKSLVRNGDLLFARRSLVLEGSGKCSLVVSPSEDTTFESSIIRARLDQGKADPRFYYYLWHSPLGRALMASIATRTAVSGITGSNLTKLKVPHPPLSTQRKIASVLSAYDDLIENNTRRIEILEEMAHRIYQEWFVNFRFPGHEKVRMVDSPLGLIPEGWGIVSFTDIADVLSGGTPKTTVPEYWNGNIPFFAPKDAPTSFYVTETEKTITEAGLNKCNSKLYSKDTVFITARGTVGKVVLPAVDMAMNQSCYALRGRNGVNQYFVFLSIREAVEQLQQQAQGAVFDTIVVDTFRRLMVVKPSLSIVDQMGDLLAPIFEQILNLLNKNKNLRHTRDLLLPKLISGEVDVSELDVDTESIQGSFV